MQPHPPEADDRTDKRTALARLRACVMADEALAAALADIEQPEDFAERAVACAALRGIALDAQDVLLAIRPDPLGLARFAPEAPGGAHWPPRHWLPVSIAMLGDNIHIDWLHFGSRPLTESFFEGSVRRALRYPFNRMFRYRMTLDDFVADAPRHPGLAPDGLIFHMSRCGSTLVTQMLAALPSTIAVSEAPPIDAVVQINNLNNLLPHLSAERHVALLRAMIAAYGRRRAGDERHYVVKLDCWHALALPLFRASFPATPWLFLYRDPVEVLVSHARQRGAQMVPEIMPPVIYGIDDAGDVPDMEYCARVLSKICHAATDGLEDGHGLAVNYRDLPGAVESRILPHFAIGCDDAGRDAMNHASRRDAKSPRFGFSGDSAAKQQEATPELRAVAGRHLAGVIRRLGA